VAKVKPIVNPDTECTDKEYWERVLQSHGLGMRRGEAPHLDDLSRVLFVGGANELEGIEEEELRNSTGHVKPSGKGPDD
jgi:hypothetical protein